MAASHKAVEQIMTILIDEIVERATISRILNRLETEVEGNASYKETIHRLKLLGRK